MKFALSASTVLSAIVLATSVFAAPTPDGRSSSSMNMGGAGKSTTMGAAYFLTNEPTGNFVVSADIGADGQLTLRRATFSGGVGAHGITTPNGPDPLFSQGAVKTSAARNVLAAVNAGSNTVSMFNINPRAPSKIKRAGRPVSTAGEFPVSLAFNAAGNSLCVVNGGKVNGVSCYSADKRRGLSPIKNTVRSLNLNQTTPATGPAGTVSHIIFSEDNKQLLVSVKGIPPAPGFIASWDIAADGSLATDFKAIAPEQGGLLPFSMSVIPGRKSILATDAGVGFDIFDLSGSGAQAVDAANLAPGAVQAGGNSSVVPIEGQGATCWSSFSAQTGNFYLTDIVTSLVTEVNVDDNLQGSIIKQYPQGNGSSTIDNDIAKIGSNDFMYVLAPDSSSVNVLSLNAPGAAANLQKLDIAGPSARAGLKINSLNLQGMTTFVKK